jgi:multidrug efflux pump subunit AcrA (membrane-fusion protein)
MSKGKRPDGAKGARKQDRGAATGGAQGPRGRLAQDLSLPLSLEEGRPPGLARHASYLVLVAIAGFFAWAATAQLTERAVARGQITPTGSSYSVQHPDGGTVAALAVSEGQTVEAGQTLLRLAPHAATADRDQLLAREAALRLKAERLRAFAQDRAPDFGFAADYPDLVADQRDILRTQRDSRAQQLSVIDRQIEQRRSRLASARDRLPEAKRQVAIMKEQLEMRRELAEKGLVSRVVLLETERAHSEATARLAGLRSEIAEARQAVDEARERLAGADASVQDALAALSAIAQALQRAQPDWVLHFDLGELRGYRYHTGVVFAAYTPGQAQELARGGRYDDIGAVFGRARPATGFSTDLKALQRLTRPNSSPAMAKAIAAPWQDDAALREQVAALRAAGEIVIWALPEPTHAQATTMKGCDRQLIVDKHGQWRVEAL